jgi:Zn-finger domain-containing protein
MKLVAQFILFVFVAFLATPTVVTLIKKNTDISMFYSFAEEENHKDLKEIKADLRLNFDYPILEVAEYQNSKIISENLARHDNIAEEIFIPPPELV